MDWSLCARSAKPITASTAHAGRCTRCIALRTAVTSTSGPVSRGGGGSAESNYNAVSAGTTLADINVNYAYQKISTAGVITTNNVISANYQFGDIRVNGAYASNSITGTDNKGSYVGASMPLNAAVSVGFTYARNSLSTLDNVRVASAEYKMSKRTYAYLNYAVFGNSAMGVYANDQGRYAASSTESLLMVGLSHSF